MDGRDRVLIVDDEPVVLDLLQMVLVAAGYHVTCCSSGLEALEQCREGTFGVMICDYGLGDLDGISLHRTLTQERHPVAERMILVTGEVADPSVDAFIRETGVPALQKPFEMDVLENLTADILRRSRVPGLR